MVPIKQNLCPQSNWKNKCPYTMTPTRIVVHNTANDASAANEVAYMIRNDNKVSFHYAIDDKEIVQGVPENRNTWNAGDGNGKGNREGISIEICYSKSGGSRFEAAQKNAAELTAKLLKDYGWGIDKVTKHQDYNGKYCPHRTLSDYGWDYFLNLVSCYLNGTTPATTKTAYVDVTYCSHDAVKNKWLPAVKNKEDYAGVLGDAMDGIAVKISTGTVTYSVHTVGGKWLGAISQYNLNDSANGFAGILNKPIDGVMIKTNTGHTIHYRVHIKGGNWLPYVTGYNSSDSNNGYAGIMGKAIDAIEVYLDPKITTTYTTTPVTPKPVAPAPEPEVQKIYRIRKTWADSKSQVGAYSSLESAKDKCQSAGDGYKVFDWNGKEVYAYVAPKVEPGAIPTPVQPIEPEVTPTPIQPKPVEPEVVPTPEVEVEIDPTPEPVQPEPKPVNPTPEPVKPEDDNDNIDVDDDLMDDLGFVLKWIRKIIEAIISAFKKSE